MPQKRVLTLLKRVGDPTRSRLVWTWPNGESTHLAELGSPTTTTDYRLCIYDGTDTIIMNALVPAGGICGTRLCWSQTSTGFRYRNVFATPNGLTSLVLKAGPAGATRVIAKAKGANLAMPTLPLAQSPGPVHVQLINSTTPACWSASYTAPARTRPTDTAVWRDIND